jgi:hypothetical protein
MVWQAIAGIAGAAASIFGQDDEPRVTETESSIDYRKLVRSAQRAGINPLTALRTGGAAGFTTQTTTAPPLTSQNLLGRIATGIGQVAEGLSNQQLWDQSQQKLALDRKLVEAQVAQLSQPSTGYQGPRVGTAVPGKGPPGMFHGPAMPGAPGQTPAMPGNKDNIVPGWLWQQTPEGGYLLGPNPEAPVEFETDAWWWLRRGVFFQEMDKVVNDNLPTPKQSIRMLQDHLYTTDPFPGSVIDSPQTHVEQMKRVLKDGYEYWEGAFDRTKKRFGPGGSAWEWHNFNPLAQPRDPIRSFHK